MTTPRRNPLTRRSAARALDGTTTSGSAHLDQILAVVTAPATEAELGREDAALTRFQQGRLAPAHRAAPAGPRARIATARIAAAGVALALLVAGGMALAAGVGPGDGLFTTPSDDPRPQAALDAPGTTSAEPTPAQDGQLVRSFAGLCRAFQAEAVTNGNVASNPDYEPLADDAGGQDEIKKYCQVMLGAPTEGPSGTPTALPTQATGSTEPARPTGAADPTGSAVPNPTVEPTVKPTQPPVPTPTATATPTQDRPGGKPTKTPRP